MDGRCGHEFVSKEPFVVKPMGALTGEMPPAAVTLPARVPHALSDEQILERARRVSRRSSFDAASSYLEIAELCRDFCESVGYDGFLFAMSFPALPDSHGKLTLNGYPKRWVEIYNARKYMLIDPVVRRGLATVEPFEWCDIDFDNETPEALELFQSAAEFGLMSGMSVHSFGKEGGQGVFNLSSRDPGFRLGEARDGVFAQAMLFASRAQDATLRVLKDEMGVVPAKPLTARQLRALQLLSAGDKNKVIASKLGISTAGVEYLVREINERLGARSRTDAVTKAVTLGLVVDFNHSLLRARVDLIPRQE